MSEDVMLYATRNSAVEWGYTSATSYGDPFHDVELDVVVTCPDGSVQVVPAFWGGEQTWRVRYSSTQTGTHEFRTVCSDATKTGLHDQVGSLQVAPYVGGNPLLVHGPLQVSGNRRVLEHVDGDTVLLVGGYVVDGFV